VYGHASGRSPYVSLKASPKTGSLKWQVNRSHPQIDGTEKRNPAVQRARAPPRSNLRQMMARAETLLSITWLASFTPQFSDLGQFHWQFGVGGRVTRSKFPIPISKCRTPASAPPCDWSIITCPRAPNNTLARRRQAGENSSGQAIQSGSDGVCVPFITFPSSPLIYARPSRTASGLDFRNGAGARWKQSICNNEKNVITVPFHWKGEESLERSVCQYS